MIEIEKRPKRREERKLESEKVRLCALITRVSTIEQAHKTDGSLTRQYDDLKDYIKHRNIPGTERYQEVAHYDLPGVSGKYSLKSKQINKLICDITEKRVNTIIISSYDRISRSLWDFLNFYHRVLLPNNVELISLRDNYDTTTEKGRVRMEEDILDAERERVKTSVRMKELRRYRTAQGRWNGGHLFGYDLQEHSKEKLIPNKQEKNIVIFIFKTYLKYGSLYKTAEIVNKLGYRTKGYTSRRGIIHPPKLFRLQTIRYILGNYAYIGLIEPHKKDGQEKDKPENQDPSNFISAIWEPIIDPKIFYKVQHLLKKNNNTKHNGITPIKHHNLLAGLIECGQCGKKMVGRSGLSRMRKRYYYYTCPDKKFNHSIPANEIEGVILQEIKMLSLKKEILNQIVNLTNKKLDREIPQVKEERSILVRELDKERNVFQRIAYSNQLGPDISEKVKEEFRRMINSSADRISEIEKRIDSLNSIIEERKSELVDQKAVLLSLTRFSELFKNIPPYEQKELMGTIVQKIVLRPDKIEVALRGHSPHSGLLPSDTASCFQTQDWLLGEDSNLQPAG